MTDKDSVNTAAEILVEVHGPVRAERILLTALAHVRREHGREITDAYDEEAAKA